MYITISCADAIASKFSRFVPNRFSEAILNQHVVKDDVHCEGDEENICDCPHSTNEDCYNHIENAGVICEGNATQTDCSLGLINCNLNSQYAQCCVSSISMNVIC